jgi:hypothetical protein
VEKPASLYIELVRVLNSIYPVDRVFHINSVAYDFYSVQELVEQKPSKKWLSFPLPGEDVQGAWLPKEQNTKTFPFLKSPSTVSGLAYVEQIYVMTDPSLDDRHINIKNAFRRQNIPVEAIKWQWKWNRTDCNSKNNKKEVFSKLNLVDQPGGKRDIFASIFLS